MYFNSLLDILLGPRVVLHKVECSVCGFDEVYYLDSITLKQIGRACESCNFIQKFDFTNWILFLTHHSILLQFFLL